MKNLYQELHINIQASLLQICQAYQTLCTKNPQKIFYYTKILNILPNQKYKLIYDAMLTGRDIRLVYYYSSLFILEEEEFVLAEVITWIEQLREFVYDTKFFTYHSLYLEKLEEWYDELESILENLKSHIKSFYLN